MCSVAVGAGDSEIVLGFTGDIMMHNTQLRRAWKGLDARGEDSGYDFGPAFESFSKYLKEPDLTIGNLETTFGGPHSALVTNERYGFREYQAYPTFTTPDELAPALAAAGFDLLGTANNHSMDSNLEGAARTLDVLKNNGLDATGTSGSGSPVPWRGDVGGFSLSVLAWTASVNGIISSRGMETINVFSAEGRDGRLEEMLEEIRQESSRNPDLLILCIHWGQEYTADPGQYQKNLADLAIEAGADIIIGSHPHMLQPLEIRNGAFVAWSMGNFISSQRHQQGLRSWVDGSAMLSLNIGRDSGGQAVVTGFSFIPLYVAWTPDNIRVISVFDGLNGDTDLSDYDRGRLEALDFWVPSQLMRYMDNLPAKQSGAGWRVSIESE